AIRSTGHAFGSLRHEDARRPATGEASHHPDAQKMQKHKGEKPSAAQLRLKSKNPQTKKPSRVQPDDERIVRASRLDRALRQQPSRVSPGEDELRASLQRDEAE